MAHLGLQSHPQVLQSFPSSVIRLGRTTRKRGFATITQQLQRRKKLPKIIRAISSPTLTAGLAGILTLLTTRSVKKAATVFGLVGVPLGIATTFPQFIPFLKSKGRPVKAGEFIGRKLRDVGKDDKKPFGERVKEGFKTAGLIGGATALGLGALSVGKKIRQRVTSIPKLPKIGLPPSPTAPLLIPPTQLLPPEIQPLAPVKKAVTEEKPLAVAPTMPKITNRITVSPKINIRFSKSKKFINQQILVR